MIDYVNFKGEGIVQQTVKWGLLQVLLQMQKAPSHMSALQAFVWAADVVLVRRIAQQGKTKVEQKWLAGWRKRVYSYLL